MAEKRKSILVRLGLDNKSFRRNLAASRRDLNEFRKGADMALRGLGLAGLGATAAIGKVGASFEQSLANMASISRANQSELAALESQARRMGATTAYSASQAAGAMTVLAQSGLSVQENIQTSESVLKLAGATMYDMTDSAELLVGAMKSFRIPTENSADVANLFARSTQVSMLNMERLSESFKYAGPVAGLFGAKIEETTGALALLADRKIDASVAGTGLRMTFAQLANPTGALKDALDGASLKTHTLADIIDILNEKGFATSEAMEAFGMRAGPAMATLLDMGGDALRNMTKSISGTNAAWESYDVQQSTAMGATKRLLSVLEELGISIYAAFGPSVKGLIEDAAKWVGKNTGNIVGFLQDMKAGFLFAIEPVREVIRWLRQHGEQMRVVGVAVGVFVTVLYTLATAMRVVHTVMALNPWGIALAAISVLIAKGLIPLIDKLGGWRAAWIHLQGAIQTGIENIRYWMRMGQTAVQDWGDALTVFKEAFIGSFVLLYKNVTDLVPKIAEVILGVQKMLTEPWNIKEAWGEITAAIAAGVEDVKQNYGEFARDLWAPLAEKHAEEMAVIQEQHDATIAGIAKRTEEELSKIGKRGGAGSVGAMVKTIDETNLPRMELPPPVLDLEPVEEYKKVTLTIMSELSDDTKSLFEDTWGSIIDTSATGTEKMRALLGGVKDMFWKLTGQIVQRWIWGEGVQVAATKTAEGEKTRAAVGGAAARMAVWAKELAIKIKDALVSLWGAVTGIYKAHSGIPFVGPLIAAGLIGSMLAVVNKFRQGFEEGGLVTGPGGRDTVRANLTAGEYVMPVGPTRQWLPVLEAMRSMTLPDLGGSPMLAGGGAQYHFHFASGSLMLADDGPTLVRFVDKVQRVLEKRVSKTYRS